MEIKRGDLVMVPIWQEKHKSGIIFKPTEEKQHSTQNILVKHLAEIYF